MTLTPGPTLAALDWSDTKSTEMPHHLELNYTIIFVALQHFVQLTQICLQQLLMRLSIFLCVTAPAKLNWME